MYHFSTEKLVWYEQILRLIALTHDLGHAPFSHASESVFPLGMEHEDFTEKIIKETCIAQYINDIGESLVGTYGDSYNIKPDLICDIYAGRLPGTNSEFTFLKSFMDSELDCDKMDYLLRDSLFCGVNYGKYDVERLLSSLTIYNQDNIPRLAINHGGIQAFEEFVLARYFMFVQVYFHRTRRYFDIMFFKALLKILPEGKYPEDTNEYLKWDDCKVNELLKFNCETDEHCGNIVYRKVYSRILHTKTHPEAADKREFQLVAQQLYDKFGKENFIEDHSADKMPHKIPVKTEVDDEKAIMIVDPDTGKCTTISEESHIIRSLTDKIEIRRLYIKPDCTNDAKQVIQKIYESIN